MALYYDDNRGYLMVDEQMFICNNFKLVLTTPKKKLFLTFSSCPQLQSNHKEAHSDKP